MQHSRQFQNNNYKTRMQVDRGVGGLKPLLNFQSPGAFYIFNPPEGSIKPSVPVSGHYSVVVFLPSDAL